VIFGNATVFLALSHLRKTIKLFQAPLHPFFHVRIISLGYGKGAPVQQNANNLQMQDLARHLSEQRDGLPATAWQARQSYLNI